MCCPGSHVPSWSTTRTRDSNFKAVVVGIYYSPTRGQTQLSSPLLRSWKIDRLMRSAKIEPEMIIIINLPLNRCQNFVQRLSFHGMGATMWVVV